MSRRARSHALTRSALALGIAAIPVLAQSPPDAGQVQRELQRKAPEVPGEAPASIQSPEQPAAAPAAGGAKFVLRGVRVGGNETLQEPVFEHIVADYLGREVSLTDLTALAQRITKHYRDAGFLVARAYLPEQEVREGVVDVQVLEGLLAARRLVAAAGVRSEVLERQLRGLQSNQVVREAHIERAALLLADVPGVASAVATLKPGAAAGSTDAEFELRASRKLSGAIELDNFGNRFVGRERVAAQVQMVNPDGWGELIGLRLVTSGSELGSARLNVQAAPLPHGWKFGLSAATTHYELGDAFADLDAAGRARTLGVYALHPLRRAQRYNVHAQLFAEHNDLQDRVLGTRTEKHSNTLTLSLAAEHRDQWLGGGVSSYTLTLGGGRLNIETAAARALDASTAGSDGGFGKIGVSLLRLQSLRERVSLYAGLSGQWSRQNLDSSEKFALGGGNAVRAYPQGEAIGDRGYLASAELRYRLSRQVLGSDVDLAAFYDQGAVRINARPWLPGEDNSRRLSGAGVGVAIARRDSFFARMNVAAKTGSEDAVSDRDKHARAWLQVIKRF